MDNTKEASAEIMRRGNCDICVADVRVTAAGVVLNLDGSLHPCKPRPALFTCPACGESCEQSSAGPKPAINVALETLESIDTALWEILRAIEKLPQEQR